MTLLQLRDEDARFVYLATVYHLGRPGSEIDPETLQRHDLGLRAVHDAMLPEIGHAVVEVEVSPYQLTRIAEALLGVANELKQSGIADGRSAVPRFRETLHWLYPETKDDPGIALDLVQHPVALHRRMAAAIDDAREAVEAARKAQHHQRQAERQRWWQRWRGRSS